MPPVTRAQGLKKSKSGKDANHARKKATRVEKPDRSHRPRAQTGHVVQKTKAVPVTITAHIDPNIDIEAEAGPGFCSDKIRLIEITATATAKKSAVASCTAWLIRRGGDDGFSLPTEDMDDESQDLSDLASVLFVSDGLKCFRGYLRSRFAKSGTRAWGDELREGEIVFFAELAVDPAFRRQGVGRRMVAKVWDMARAITGPGCDIFSIVAPGVVTHVLCAAVRAAGAAADEGAIREEQKLLALAFWRALEFRRIGTSKWLAYAEAPDHPSKHIDDTHVIEDEDGSPDSQSEDAPNEEDYSAEVWARAEMEGIHPDDVGWDDPSPRQRAKDRYWARIEREVEAEEDLKERKRRDPYYFLR